MAYRIVKQFILASLTLQATHARGEDQTKKTKEPSEARSEALLRTEGPLVDMRLNPDKSLMAFVDGRGQSLRIMDLSSQDVYEVTPHRVGSAYFWSPDGKRLFFRELIRDGEKVSTEVQAYDVALHKSVRLDRFDGSSGFLTLDPRDYTYYMMHEKGIASRRLDFPGERYAQWQVRAKKSIDLGRYVATQKSVLWISDLGLTLSTLKDDNSGVESFDISPDGTTIAWATNNSQLYVSHLGEAPKLLGPGRDPRWHLSRSLLLYSAGRLVGDKIYDFDIRISDVKGQGRYLTSTPDIKERWPQWWSDSKVLYTREGSTDLWQLKYRDSPEMTAQSAKPKPVNQ